MRLSSISTARRATRSGLVEAMADVEILRPTIAANGNRRLFYDVVNRGGKLALALFNDCPASSTIPSRPPMPATAF